MRILLVCDHQWRDLPALVAIKHHLKKLDHNVLIASAKEFEALLPVYQPDVVVLNHFWDERYRRLARQLRKCGIAVVVLPTEGSGSTEIWGPMIFGKFTDYSLIDYHLCWNSQWSEGIANAGTMPREKLEVVGCPRFDFSVAPLDKTCMTREQLCQQLGLDPSRPIVTFAGNFAFAKLAYAKESARASFERQSASTGFTQSIADLGFTTDELIRVYKSSLDKLTEAFGAAAKAFPECQFVYKPHPNNDVVYIQNQIDAMSLPNTVIALGVYIADVLRGSDVLVNSNCTTSIEAWLHNVPVVDAQLEQDLITGRADIAACNWTATDNAQVIEGIRAGLQRSTVSPELLAARSAFIEKWFHKVDGQRCMAAAQSLDRFARSWGRRQKFYPVSYGGGARSVVRAAAGWIAGLPSGAKFSELASSRRQDWVRAGIFDKVITRRHVRDAEMRLKPMLAANG